MATFYNDTTEEIHVMLIDCNEEFVTKMVGLLKSYDYKVTTVDTTSAAISTLSKGKQKIDVMIINIPSSNMLSFHLLTQAVALDIISLVVCDEHNEIITKKALEEGAYLCLEKPIDEEIVKYLWQFVLRKKMQREKMKKGSEKNRDHINVDDIAKNDIVGENEEQFREKKKVANTEEQKNNIHEVENDIVSNEKYKLKRKRGSKNMKEINEGEIHSSTVNTVVRQKDCREWTDDLHAKFMEAVQQLGEGNCFPKDIQEVMHVPGLTRIQIASHLQKCRIKTYKAPKERKSIHHPSGQGSSNGSQQKSSFRKYGIMPCLQTNVANLQRNVDQTQREKDFPFPTLNANNSFSRGVSSTQQLYRPQLQLQSHNLNNPFLSVQNYDCSVLQQQQHEPLFKMLDSQGLNGPVIENTSYSPCPEFNSGDSLDLNVVHGGTYSDRGIMFGTEIGNVTVNEFNLNANADIITPYSGSVISNTYVGNAATNAWGTANSNFQQYISGPNVSNPNNIAATSYESDIEGTDSNCDAYLDFNNMDYLFENHGPPGASIPNEQGGKEIESPIFKE